MAAARPSARRRYIKPKGVVRKGAVSSICSVAPRRLKITGQNTAANDGGLRPLLVTQCGTGRKGSAKTGRRKISPPHLCRRRSYQWSDAHTCGRKYSEQIADIRSHAGPPFDAANEGWSEANKTWQKCDRYLLLFAFRCTVERQYLLNSKTGMLRELDEFVRIVVSSARGAFPNNKSDE
jgi:hypothetical protein